MISAAEENARLSELVRQCQDREAVENWVALVSRLDSLSQWAGIDALGCVWIFDKKPNPGPIPVWWNEEYVPSWRPCSPSFEEKLKGFAGLVFTANDLLISAKQVARNVFGRDIRFRPLEDHTLCEIQAMQIRLEQEKSKQLMREMLRYFRETGNSKAPVHELLPMFNAFKRFNYED